SVADESQLIELYLFGTPGQSRFDFMWDILSKVMLGYVLLVDATRPETWTDAAAIKAKFDELGDVPLVVGVNRGTESDVDKVVAALRLDEAVPVLACEATDKESVKQVLITLLINVVEQLEATVKGSI
ncbi:MAG: ATP/GTP-binding protein, partial [Acidimicrobiia bacterium]|nr:ATP/GTP-binding protein [Acidimicrobiia bacterium]